MDTTLTKPQVWQRWREAEHLGLLAAFEDSVTGTRVKEFCQGLSRDLGQHCRITEHVWLFNTLRLQELREIAARKPPRQTSSLFLFTSLSNCLMK